MLKFFSLPIAIAIGLGLMFPYQSMSLIWISSILLFLLLFLNTLAVEPAQLFAVTKRGGARTALAMGLIFVFSPLLLAAASRLLLKDQDFAFGVVVTALAPSALVNPFFARLRGGDDAMSLVDVILSTLICPFITVPMLQALGYSSVYLDPKYAIVFLVSLTILPVAFSVACARLFPKSRAATAPLLSYFNSFILAGLMFILVGASLNRMPLRFLLQGDLPVLFLIFLVSDFGFYFAARICGALFASSSSAETLALSVSSRNFAVSASLMLFFYPKAALPAAVGLIVHALFFQFLTWKRSRHFAAAAFALVLLRPGLSQAMPVPYAREIAICLPAYGERAGTLAFLAAESLGYFDRADLKPIFRRTKGSVAAAVVKRECAVGLASRDEIESLSPAALKKISSERYLVPGEGGTARLIVRAGKRSLRLGRIGAGKIRVPDPALGLALEKHFAKLGLPKPVLVLEPDPSRAINDLRARKIAAGIFHDPFAAALLSTKQWKVHALDAEGLDDADAQRTPAIFLIHDGPPGGLNHVFSDAFDYLDINPSQNLDFVRKNAGRLGLTAPLEGFPRPPFTGIYYSEPFLRTPLKSEIFERDSKFLRERAPKTAAWLSSF